MSFVKWHCMIFSAYELMAMAGRDVSGSDAVRDFLMMMAVCHTVIPDRDEKNGKVIQYHAASPGMFPLWLEPRSEKHSAYEHFQRSTVAYPVYTSGTKLAPRICKKGSNLNVK